MGLASRLGIYLTAAEGEGGSGAVLVARNRKTMRERGFGVSNPATGARILVQVADDLGKLEYRGIAETENCVEVRLFILTKQKPFFLQMRIEPQAPYRISGPGGEAGG